jgi:hypothetical protein
MVMFCLDIDGVLNSKRTWMGLGNAYPHGGVSEVHLDATAVGLLKDLATQIGDVKVYIHSSWMQYVTNAWIQSLFLQYGWNLHDVLLPFLGMTAHDSRMDRVLAAVKAYLPSEYVIFDDVRVSDPNLIYVDQENGLSWENYVAVLNRFGKKEPIILL